MAHLACTLTACCRSFLERMAAHAAEHGPVGSSGGRAGGTSTSNSAFESIPVYVAPVQHNQQQQQQQPVHELMGYVAVPVDAPAQQVYHTLQVQAVTTC